MLEHARAAEAAGAHRFCMVTQGQGLSKRDFEKVLEGARLVAEHTNLKRCASIGHMSAPRAKALREAGIQRVHHNVETAESYYDEVSTTVRYAARLRTIDAVREAGPRDLRRRDPQPRRVARAARRDGLRAGQDRPHERPHQPPQPAAGHEVRRPRLHGPVGGGQVDRHLPPHPPRRALPPLRRPRREPRRAAAAGGQGRPQRRDDGQLPHDARLDARRGPGDVHRAGPQRRAPARQRRQPAAGQPLGLARGRPAGARARARTSPRRWSSTSACGIRRRSCASSARPRCPPDRTGRRTAGQAKRPEEGPHT